MDAIENLAKFEEDQVSELSGPTLEEMVKEIYDFIIGSKPEDITEEPEQPIEVKEEVKTEEE